MPKKRLKLLFGLALAFVAFFAFYFFIEDYFYYKIKVPTDYDSIDQVVSPPVSLKIPTLGIDVKILPLGITEEGNMDTPEEAMDTGWFHLGPAPGGLGSAVIAGHRGWKLGPAIFDNLHQIKVGEEVRVVNQKGEEHIFRVREISIYDAEEKVPEVWLRDDGRYLNLITCSGRRNILTGTSEKRLVVFTELVI